APCQTPAALPESALSVESAPPQPPHQLQPRQLTPSNSAQETPAANVPFASSSHQTHQPRIPPVIAPAHPATPDPCSLIPDPCLTLTLMPLATLTLELAIEHAQSLKDRRQVVRSLKEKLRHGFNISVAELDDAALWNRATLGIAAISQSSSYLSGQLREVESAARRFAVGLGCDIIDSW